MPARYVSSSVKRTEDPPLLKGQARFMSDLCLPGLRVVAFLRSLHAHAKLVAIDSSRALQIPGVEAVVTGADLRTSVHSIRAVMNDPGYRQSSWPPLALDKVRFVGEPVAAVVARDRYLAEDALDAIGVTYEPLAAVIDAEASMRAD